MKYHSIVSKITSVWMLEIFFLSSSTFHHELTDRMVGNAEAWWGSFHGVCIFGKLLTAGLIRVKKLIYISRMMIFLDYKVQWPN